MGAVKRRGAKGLSAQDDGPRREMKAAVALAGGVGVGRVHGQSPWLLLRSAEAKKRADEVRETSSALGGGDSERTVAAGRLRDAGQSARGTRRELINASGVPSGESAVEKTVFAVSPKALRSRILR